MNSYRVPQQARWKQGTRGNLMHCVPNTEQRWGLRKRTLHLHAVKPGNLTLLEFRASAETSCRRPSHRHHMGIASACLIRILLSTTESINSIRQSTGSSLQHKDCDCTQSIPQRPSVTSTRHPAKLRQPARPHDTESWREMMVDRSGVTFYQTSFYPAICIVWSEGFASAHGF